MRQASVPSGISPQPKYSQSKIEANIYEENKILLNQIMENEKPYLLPELNLDELAKMLNKPPKQLSQTINLGFSMNFNTYINRYRINEAKRIIELDVNDKKTIYEILLDAGFNSKSVFNDAFKKHAGCTPKEYRRLIKLQTAQ
jgi:AraC-like DNA-binding protein